MKKYLQIITITVIAASCGQAVQPVIPQDKEIESKI